MLRFGFGDPLAFQAVDQLHLGTLRVRVRVRVWVRVRIRVRVRVRVRAVEELHLGTLGLELGKGELLTGLDPSVRARVRN